MPSKNLTSSQILFIIWLEGFVTISVEILAIRQLLPSVGSSVIITSLIIGVFLLFLAYGYQAGGRKQTELLPKLSRNFFWAAIAIGFGLSYAFITLFFSAANYFHLNVLVVLIAYLLLIIAPTVYFLGQTVPITMNLLPLQTVGALGGKVLHLSTLGSFLGAVLTSLIFMNFLGVAWTIVINYLVLAFLILLMTTPQRLPVMGLILLVIGCLVYIANRQFEISFFAKTTSYGNYQILPETKLATGQVGRVLSINNSYSSFIDEQKKTFPYMEMFKKILFNELKLTNRDILVLGAGGFTLSAENTFGNRFTYVDIEPQIQDIVKAHFLQPIHGTFIAADARRYVKEHPGRYDVIVADTFSNIYTIPSQLLTLQYFRDLKAALKPNGIALINIISAPLLNTVYAKRVDNTIRAAFGSCTVSPLSFERQQSNMIYVCQNNKEASDKMIYTDDMNRSSLDVYNQG